MSDENNDDLTQLLLRVVEASEKAEKTASETNHIIANFNRKTTSIEDACQVADRASDVLNSSKIRIETCVRFTEDEVEKLKKEIKKIKEVTIDLTEAKQPRRWRTALYILFSIIAVLFLFNQVGRVAAPYTYNMMDPETCQKVGGNIGTTDGTKRKYCIIWEHGLQ